MTLISPKIIRVENHISRRNGPFYSLLNHVECYNYNNFWHKVVKPRVNKIISYPQAKQLQEPWKCQKKRT